MALTNTFNPADVIVTPGHGVLLGTTLFAQGNVMERRLRPTDIKRVAHSGRQVASVKSLGFQITIPVLLPFAALVPFLQAYAGTPYGRPVAPRIMVVSAMNTSTDVLTSAGHILSTGDEILAGYDETAPTLASGSITKRAPYWASKLDGTTFKMHTSSDGASGDTDVVNFSAVQTLGNFWVSKMVPLAVYRRTNVLRTYLNTVISGFPDLVCQGGELSWAGNLVLWAGPAYGALPSDGDAAFFTEAMSAYASPAWDAATALSLPANAAWGAAPWDDLASETGYRVSFKPTLGDINDSVWPVAGKKLTAFDASVKLRPQGITRTQFDAVHAEQLGGQLSIARNFVCTIGANTLTLYGAARVAEADTQLSQTDQILGDVELQALGDGTSDNLPPFAIS